MIAHMQVTNQPATQVRSCTSSDTIVPADALVYVATYPEAPHGEFPEPSEWIDPGPLLERVGEDRFVLDTDRWLEAESGLFDPSTVEHLRVAPSGGAGRGERPTRSFHRCRPRSGRGS